MTDKWLFDDRLTLSVGYYPLWANHDFGFHENGWRQSNEVFDFTLRIGKCTLGLTLWRIGAWRALFRFIPVRYRNNGKPLGWSLFLSDFLHRGGMAIKRKGRVSHDIHT